MKEWQQYNITEPYLVHMEPARARVLTLSTNEIVKDRMSTLISSLHKLDLRGTESTTSARTSNLSQE